MVLTQGRMFLMTSLLRFVGAVFGALMIAAPASADFSITPDTTWMTNGFVRSVIRDGDRIYIGGKFTSVRACPPGTACASFPVNNVAAFNANTGVAIDSFRPAVTGDGAVVYALAVLDGKLFIGGKFAAIGGLPRFNFGAVDLTTGAVDTDVDATVGTEPTHLVKALLAVGGRLYMGGVFSSVDTAPRSRLAAFDSAGNLDPVWRPRADGAVSSLLLSCDGQTIFTGGKFRRAAAPGQAFQDRPTIARFDIATAALHPWRIPAGEIASDLHAYDLATSCDRIFAAYAGSNWAYALDLSDDNVGNRIWGIKTAGDVQTVAVRGTQVLLGGHFSQIDAVNQNNAKRTRFAVVDLDGNIDPWNPPLEGRFFGPWDILVDGNNRVWIGGDFLTVSGVAQRGIVRFTDPSPP
jgi:trimeric autotransporter adhesin